MWHCTRNIYLNIQSSLDWQAAHANLRNQIEQLPYNPVLRRMLNNITNMVSELSKSEVEARRYNKLSAVKDDVDKINQAIDYLEKMLLIAKLIH